MKIYVVCDLEGTAGVFDFKLQCMEEERYYQQAIRMATLELNNLTVSRKTSGNIPLLPYQKMKDSVLGKKYELDISFVDTQTSTQLHKEFKKKSGPANILSFPYEEDAGEIIIHLETVRRQARQYGRTYHEHLLFLIIHGMLHLLGYEHGDEMEGLEEGWFGKLKP